MTDVDEIIVVRDGLLRYIKITPLWSNPDDVIIRDNIQPGDLLSTSSLSYAPEGYPVHIISEDEVAQAEADKLEKTQKPHQGGGHHSGHGH